MSGEHGLPERSTTVMWIACTALLCMLLSFPSLYSSCRQVAALNLTSYSEAVQVVLKRTPFSVPEDKALVASAFSLAVSCWSCVYLCCLMYAVGLVAVGWIAYREFMLPAPKALSEESAIDRIRRQ